MGATFAKNRRKGSRHRLDIPATLAVDGDQSQQFSVYITDLSVSGVGIASSQALPMGSVFEVDAFDTLLPLGTRVQIVSSRHAGCGGFEIGAKVC